jgi:hypothetical protein
LGRVEPVIQAAAKVEIAAAAAQLLHVDLIDMLVDGSRKHEDLLAAARRTAAAPGTTEVVDLATHRVTGAEHPYVDVIVDGATVATVHLDLSVVFDVNVLVAAVRSVKIVALHAGDTDITASLVVDGVSVASRKEHLVLPLNVDLGDGIPLLSDASASPAGGPDS